VAPTRSKQTPAPEAVEDEDRPTAVPLFDPEAFARASELKQRAVRAITEEPPIDEARRLMEEGEPEQALFVLARLLASAPGDEEALELSQACGAALESDCVDALGSLRAKLAIVVPPEELKEVGLDQLSGFLLSLIDGATDVETVLDLSGRSRLLVLRHLRGLVERGILRVIGGRR